MEGETAGYYGKTIAEQMERSQMITSQQWRRLENEMNLCQSTDVQLQ